MNRDEYDAHVAATMLESALQAQIISVAHALNWWEYHPHDSRRSRAGWPDLVLVRPPRIVFAELKRQRERPTKVQEHVLGLLRACGLEVHVWRPLDLFQGRVLEVLQGTGPAPSGRVTSPPTPVEGTASTGEPTRRMPR